MYVCMLASACMYACVCVCVCMRHTFTQKHIFYVHTTHKHTTHTRIYNTHTHTRLTQVSPESQAHHAAASHQSRYACLSQDEKSNLQRSTHPICTHTTYTRNITNKTHSCLASIPGAPWSSFPSKHICLPFSGCESQPPGMTPLYIPLSSQ
jgi:hypothetical protein